MPYREATQTEAEEFCSNSPGCPVMFIREDDPYLLRRREGDDTPDLDAIEKEHAKLDEGAFAYCEACGSRDWPCQTARLVRRVRELEAWIGREHPGLDVTVIR